MLKKLIVGGLAAAALGTFVFGRDVCSYAKTGANSVRNAVKAEVPLEFELARAREMVENLIPEIRSSMHVIAEQQVDIDYLHESIARKDTELNRQKVAILALRNDLNDGSSKFVYAGHTYTSEEVSEDLNHRFGRYKTASETLETDRKILRAREQSLAANQKKLAGMLNAKKDLEVRLEQLDARIKSIRAAEAVSDLHIDDSQLTRAKGLIRDLNKQLDVKERMLDADGRFAGLIPIEEEASIPVDLGNQIDEYFGGATADEESTPVEEPTL